MPEHIALVGGQDVVPSALAGGAMTDRIYGNSEFALAGHQHIGVGRIYTLNLTMASILASRTVNHQLLKDGVWDRSFVECGAWPLPQLRVAFQNAGYSPAENQEHIFGKNIIDVPTVNASVLLHNNTRSCRCCIVEQSCCIVEF